jgi:hypothetical protein
VAKEPAWLRDCLMGSQISKSGKPKPLPVLENALIALRRDPFFRDLLSYDEMECAAILHRSLEPDPPAGFAPRPVSDVDCSRIQAKLQRLGLSRLSKDTTHQAVAAVADDRRAHPVRDYLTGLSGTASRASRAGCRSISASSGHPTAKASERCF